jgi:hypothetical protein
MRPLTGSRPPQDLRDEEARKKTLFKPSRISVNCRGVGDPKSGHPELSRCLPMVVREFNHCFSILTTYMGTMVIRPYIFHEQLIA